jgi:hypothetical protein
MKKRELNDETFDKLLRYAAARQLEKIADQAPAEVARKYTFSNEFEDKMQRLFSRQRRFERNERIRKAVAKVAAITVIFLAASTIAVLSVDAWRVRMLNIISEIGEKSTTIVIDDEEVNYDRFLNKVQGKHLPSYIPYGYMTDSIEEFGSYYLVTYKNNAGAVIQLQKLPGGSSVGIDSEDAHIEQILVTGKVAQYFYKNEIGSLMFKYNEIAFLLNASLAKDELIKIAESMEYKK